MKIINDDKLIRGKGGRGPFRGRCGKGRRQSLNISTIKCFKCYKLGHFQYELPDWEKKVYYAELEEDEEVLLVEYEELHQTIQEEVWFLDSDYSNI